MHILWKGLFELFGANKLANLGNTLIRLVPVPLPLKPIIDVMRFKFKRGFYPAITY